MGGELRREISKSYRAADYKQGLEAATKLHELEPDNPLVMYNIACLNCLLGEKDKAFDWLERSVNAGFHDAELMANDYDLKTLWGQRRFRALVQQLRDGEAKSMNPGEKEARKDSKKNSEEKAVEDEPLPKIPKLTPQAHGEKIQALTQELIRVSADGKRDKALEISLTALAHAQALEEAIGRQAYASLSLTHYNVCCMYSLKKETDRAIRHLELAVKYLVPGFDIVEQMGDDSDLDAIRKDPRYAAALTRAKEKTASFGEDADRPRDRRARPRGGERSDGEGEKAAATEKREEKPARADVKSMTEAERNKRLAELNPALIEASRKGDYKKALEFSLEAVALADIPLTNYNAACMYSLNKDKDKAFEHLFRTFEVGQWDGNPVQQLKNDDDLTYLRSDPRWAKVIEKAEAQLAERRALPKDKEVEFEYEITLPPDYDKSKPAPLLVALHHYHGGMNNSIERWKAAAADSGAILLTPQGTWEAGEGSGSFQWGMDLDPIDRNIMKAINEAMDKYKVDENRVALAGFSQGGWVAYALALRHPDAFCGVIPVAGMFRPESESVFSGERLKKMRLYIMVGADDNSQLIKGNEVAKDRFDRAGATVELVEFKGVGHGFPPDSDQQLRKAVRFVFDR